MSIISDGTSFIRSGNGIFKPSARPISIQIGNDGEYWLCDDGVDPNKDFREQGCVGHSDGCFLLDHLQFIVCHL